MPNPSEVFFNASTLSDVVATTTSSSEVIDANSSFYRQVLPTMFEDVYKNYIHHEYCQNPDNLDACAVVPFDETEEMNAGQSLGDMMNAALGTIGWGLGVASNGIGQALSSTYNGLGWLCAKGGSLISQAPGAFNDYVMQPGNNYIVQPIFDVSEIDEKLTEAYTAVVEDPSIIATMTKNGFFSAANAVTSSPAMAKETFNALPNEAKLVILLSASITAGYLAGKVTNSLYNTVADKVSNLRAQPEDEPQQTMEGTLTK